MKMFLFLSLLMFVGLERDAILQRDRGNCRMKKSILQGYPEGEFMLKKSFLFYLTTTYSLLAKLFDFNKHLYMKNLLLWFCK